MPRFSELIVTAGSAVQLEAITGASSVRALDAKDHADDATIPLSSVTTIVYQTDSTAKTLNLQLPADLRYRAAGDRFRVVLDDIDTAVVVKLPANHNWSDQTTGDLTYPADANYQALDFVYMGDMEWSQPYSPA